MIHNTDMQEPKAKSQLIGVKESVAWFRSGQDYNLNVTKGAGFGEWLKPVEKGVF